MVSNTRCVRSAFSPNDKKSTRGGGDGDVAFFRSRRSFVMAWMSRWAVCSGLSKVKVSMIVLLSSLSNT